MALPPYMHFPRLAAGVLRVVSGLASLVLVFLDREADLAAIILGQPFPNWFREDRSRRVDEFVVSQVALVLQR